MQQQQIVNAAFQGRLVRPDGEGPRHALAMFHEWWGVTPQMIETAERFATAGFAVLLVDLYRGESSLDPDRAGQLMGGLDPAGGVRDGVAAAEWLAAQPWSGESVAAIGFSMGGQYALETACASPYVSAAVSFYGKNPDPIEGVAGLRGPVLALYAELDDWVEAPDRVALEAAMAGHGKALTTRVYPAVPHAFFNHHRPEAYDASTADEAFQRAVAFLRASIR